MRFHDDSCACPTAGAVDQSRIKLRTYFRTYQQVVLGCIVCTSTIWLEVWTVECSPLSARNKWPNIGKTHTHLVSWPIGMSPASSLSLTLPCVSGSVIQPCKVLVGLHPCRWVCMSEILNDKSTNPFNPIYTETSNTVYAHITSTLKPLFIDTNCNNTPPPNWVQFEYSKYHWLVSRRLKHFKLDRTL